MTSSRRSMRTVNSVQCDSAWSPMPEHLLSFKTDDDKSPFPDVGGSSGGNEHVCDVCDMKFKSRAQLIYHKAAFCFGKPVDKTSRSPSPQDGEQSALVPGVTTVFIDKSGKPASTRPVTGAVKTSGDVITADDVIDDTGSISGDGTMREKTESEKNEKTQVKLPVWRKGSDGKVPDFALKVDDVASSPLYVCLAHIRDERLPGTVIPVDYGATFAVDGEEYKGCDYDVITDADGRLTWERCEFVGGIPYNAVKGGYDKNKLQLYIARVTAPDGTLRVGKYVPHKLQCYYAWEGTEYTTSDYELLCLTSPSASETGAKEGTINIAKERTEEIAKARTVGMAEESTKEIAKERTQQMTKERTQPIAKERTQHIARKRTQYIAKETTQHIAKERTQHNAKETTQQIAKDRTQHIAKEGTKEIATGRTQQIAKERTQQIPKLRTQQIAKENTTELTKEETFQNDFANSFVQ